MSRGLGKMQRLILNSLEESKQWANSSDEPKYQGHGRYVAGANEVIFHGEKIKLGNGVYDLSGTLMYLAQKMRKTYANINSGGVLIDRCFRNSFWRAARRLIDQEYLDPVYPYVKQQRIVWIGDKGYEIIG